jgi:hypothetical protein
MFSNAKKVSSVASPAKGKIAAKPVDTLPGLAEVAALDACLKAVKGLLDMKKAALKEVAQEQLVANGLERHARPDVVHFVEGEFANGKATVSRRSTASPLSADELEVLAEMFDAERDEDGNIVSVPGFAETVEKHPAMLAVNPIYANDEALLKRIDAALKNVKNVPEDFIVQVAADSKVVVSESATDEVFKLSPEKAAMVFPMVAGVTFSAVFKSIEKAWEVVKPMLVPDAKASVKSMLKASLKAS